jgi:hypothetical protein
LSHVYYQVSEQGLKFMAVLLEKQVKIITEYIAGISRGSRIGQISLSSIVPAIFALVYFFSNIQGGLLL